MADKTTVKFPCGSTGHPDYCPGECGFGRYCKFLKTQSAKPRGAQIAKQIMNASKPAETHDSNSPNVEMYY